MLTDVKRWRLNLRSEEFVRFEGLLNTPYDHSGDRDMYAPGHRPCYANKFKQEAGLTTRLDQTVLYDVQQVLRFICRRRSHLLPANHIPLRSVSGSDATHALHDKFLPDRCALPCDPKKPETDTPTPTPQRPTYLTVPNQIPASDKYGLYQDEETEAWSFVLPHSTELAWCVGDIKPSYKFNPQWANWNGNGFMTAPRSATGSEYRKVLAQLKYYMNLIGERNFNQSIIYGYIITDKHLILAKRTLVDGRPVLEVTDGFPLQPTGQLARDEPSGMSAILLIHLLAGRGTLLPRDPESLNDQEQEDRLEYAQQQGIQIQF